MSINITNPPATGGAGAPTKVIESPITVPGFWTIPAGVNTIINTPFIDKPILVNIQSNSTQNRFAGAFPIGGLYRANAIRQFNTTSFIVQTDSNGDFTVFASGNNCFAGLRAIFDE